MKKNNVKTNWGVGAAEAKLDQLHYMISQETAMNKKLEKANQNLISDPALVCISCALSKMKIFIIQMQQYSTDIKYLDPS